MAILVFENKVRVAMLAYGGCFTPFLLFGLKDSRTITARDPQFSAHAWVSKRPFLMELLTSHSVQNFPSP